MDKEELAIGIIFAVGTAAGGAAWMIVRSPRHRLADQPLRHHGLEPLDVFAAMCIFLIGQVAAVAAAKLVRNSPHFAADVREPAAILTGQALMHGVVAAFILVRVHTARTGGMRALGLWPLARPWHALCLLGATAVGIPIVFATLYATVIVGELIRGEPPPPAGHFMLEQIRAARSPVTLGLLYVSAVVVAPVAEEIIFRGLIQNVLVRYMGAARRWWAIFITSLLFAAIHLGATPIPEPIIALFVLSMLFGWLYERTGNLWLPIALHAIFNALNIVALRLFVDA